METEKSKQADTPDVSEDFLTIKKILQERYGVDGIDANEELNAIGCLFCVIQYSESMWLFSLNNTFVKNSYEINDCLSLVQDLTKSGINFEIVPGSFTIISDDGEIYDDVVYAVDVWEYMDTYDVNEKFAVNALTAKVIEDNFRKELN